MGRKFVETGKWAIALFKSGHEHLGHLPIWKFPGAHGGQGFSQMPYGMPCIFVDTSKQAFAGAFALL